LKTAFQKINLGYLLAEVPDKHLGVNVQAHLGKVKLRAREEIERIQQAIQIQQTNQSATIPASIPVACRSSLASLLTSKKYGESLQQLKMDFNEFAGFRIHIAANGIQKSINGQSRMGFRNPFDIQRDQLLVQIAKMRVNLKQNLCNGSTPHLVGAKPGMKYRLQDVGK
jgi:hypothetical protein